MTSDTSDTDMSVLLIEKKTGRAAGNYGCASRKWLEQLEEIRQLPEHPLHNA